tara:strand:+ start:6144 stop:6380 length:237 start_codon:yes stop_codon:yes gene_type:complete
LALLPIERARLGVVATGDEVRTGCACVVMIWRGFGQGQVEWGRVERPSRAAAFSNEKASALFEASVVGPVVPGFNACE